MNPEIGVPLLVVIVGSFALVVRWFRHRERMAQIAAEAARPAVDSERMARLEQAVESIAIETERVGEGQRYLTRLLAERADRESARAADRPLRPGASNTPH